MSSSLRVPSRRRFEVEAQRFASARLTSRDDEILLRVARHRFLTSRQISRLIAGSPQQLLRRLQMLFHKGYLARPRAQLHTEFRRHSQAMVYGLASRGAGYLRRVFDFPFSTMDWTRRNGEIRHLFLDHALMVSEFAVGLECDCHRRGIAFEQLECAPLDVSPSNGGTTRVVPDAAFRLSSGGESSPRLFLLEADRGTMPIARKRPGQSSIAGKLDAYVKAWSAKALEREFGFQRGHVLFLTTGQKRAAHILEAVQSLPKGRGLFSVADESHFRSNDATRVEWQRAHGTPASLVD